jgi:hypothetical protein
MSMSLGLVIKNAEQQQKQNHHHHNVPLWNMDPQHCVLVLVLVGWLLSQKMLH